MGTLEWGGGLEQSGSKRSLLTGPQKGTCGEAQVQCPAQAHLNHQLLLLLLLKLPEEPSPGMDLPQLLAHPIIPHGYQPLLASADDFPVIHLDSRDPKLVGGERQGDFISAEVMDPHPARPRKKRKGKRDQR